ncbi:SHOCT domain-containing protein [Streptomyces sp. ISL-66]|uniref:SHOCT domain-containing protein n=1 Tax=Streptomyces sp. ISL-66 TaxID=2819186 RepID=UPI001BE972BF|nr:SHOCT domain-containing protein [Streptomyces sp. ISL-66]MBT2469748.1 SHOCT domain-containing protein [Streptomyces sp. ISL-66]
MFIRPIGSVVNPSQRPSGRPLLRGILARGSYVWDAARPSAETPHAPESEPAPHTPHAPEGTGPAAVRNATPGAASGPAPAPPMAGADRPASSTAAGGPGGPGAPGPLSPGAELTDHLTQLAALAREGLLTPEEFSAAKARLLAG